MRALIHLHIFECVWVIGVSKNLKSASESAQIFWIRIRSWSETSQLNIGKYSVLAAAQFRFNKLNQFQKLIESQNIWNIFIARGSGCGWLKSGSDPAAAEMRKPRSCSWTVFCSSLVCAWARCEVKQTMAAESLRCLDIISGIKFAISATWRMINHTHQPLDNSKCRTLAGLSSCSLN